MRNRIRRRLGQTNKSTSDFEINKIFLPSIYLPSHLTPMSQHHGFRVFRVRQGTQGRDVAKGKRAPRLLFVRFSFQFRFFIFFGDPPAFVARLARVRHGGGKRLPRRA